MKVFEEGGKINFVDENNVFVGYDLSQDCCEYADWFVSNKEETYKYDLKLKKDKNLSKYSFDIKYFKKSDGGDLDGGGIAIFKLISDNGEDLYLHIFNSHNGYYGHGFESKIDGIPWESGCL